MSSPTKLIIQGCAINANALLAKALPEPLGPTSTQNQINCQYFRAKQHCNELIALEQRILDAQWQANEFVRKAIVAQREQIKYSFEEWVNQLKIPKLLESLTEKIIIWEKRIKILESKMDNDALALFEKLESDEKAKKKTKIRLRTFSGSREDWIPFWETFDALVHQNNSLTNLEKFELLERNFEDSAQPLLEWVGRTEEEYDIAIDFLLKMFENEGRWFKTLDPKNFGLTNIDSKFNLQKANDNFGPCSLVLKVSKIKLSVNQTIKIDEKKQLQDQKSVDIQPNQNFQEQNNHNSSSIRRDILIQKQNLKPSSSILVREKASYSGLKYRLRKYFKAKQLVVSGSIKKSTQINKAESVHQNQQLFGSHLQNLIEPQNKCNALIANLHVIEPNEIVQSAHDKGLKNAKLNMKNPVSGTFKVKLMKVNDGKGETKVSLNFHLTETKLPIKMSSLMDENIKFPNKFLRKTALVHDKPKEIGIFRKFIKEKLAKSVCGLNKKIDSSFSEENTERNNELEKSLNYRSEFVSKSNPFSSCLNKALELMIKSNKKAKNKFDYQQQTSLKNNVFTRKRINDNQFFKNWVWLSTFKIWKRFKYPKTMQTSSRLSENDSAKSNAESANELAITLEAIDQAGEPDNEENKTGFLLTSGKKLKKSTILEQNSFVSEHFDLFLCHWVCPTTNKYCPKSDKMTKLWLVLNEFFEIEINKERVSEIICMNKSSLLEPNSKIGLKQFKIVASSRQKLKTNSLKEYYSSLIKLSGEVFYGMKIETKKQKVEFIKAFELQFLIRKQCKRFEFLANFQNNLLVKACLIDRLLISFVEIMPFGRQYVILLLSEQLVAQRQISGLEMIPQLLNGAHSMPLSSQWRQLPTMCMNGQMTTMRQMFMCKQCANMVMCQCAEWTFQMGSVKNEPKENLFKWGVLEMSEK